jgi:8-oxo-dGTP pyrophosphatase MutT (NUDIX family)
MDEGSAIGDDGALLAHPRHRMRPTDAQIMLPLADAFAAYGAQFPEESTDGNGFAHFLGLLAEGAHGFERSRLAGHFTASARLVDATGERVLLTHHRKLDRWLQLGGHADGDQDLARVALREAEEESGLFGLVVEPDIFDLDRHWIPERKDVPGHWHYDVRYVVRTTASDAFVVSEESLALAWREIAALGDEPGLDPSIQRMVWKWVSKRAKPMPGPRER